jgi:hypothetical protein
MTLAEHLLGRIRHDPRLAYHFDPLTRSMEMLTAQFAEERGIDVESFRKDYYPTLKIERPVCPECADGAPRLKAGSR